MIIFLVVENEGGGARVCILCFWKALAFYESNIKWRLKVENFTPIWYGDKGGTRRALRGENFGNVPCRAMCNSEKVFKMWLKIIKDRLKLYI